MSSVPEERNFIIQKYIPKLITHLTKFNPNDENYKLCLQFAWSHVKHHRYLSVSSHEVRRDIEGICEKLKINNFHDEQKQFKNIVEDLVCHELAVNHYTKDAMYSIINLLTTLAYDPINRLKEKKRRGLTVFQKIKKFEEIDSKDGQIIVKSLLEDNFKLLKNETDSELSEWTESSDDEQQKSTDESDSEAYQSKSSTSTTLKPPQKPKVFTNFSFERIENEKWLNDNLQNSWWRPNEVYHCEINSTHPAASFCLDWQKHLTKRSLGFIKPQSVSLLSENCLLREIFWMFANAVDCKFFKFSKNEISVRPNVSMPSTTTQTLHIFLNEFVKSMKIMHALKQEIEKAFKNGALSHTLENYYRMLQIFLDDIIEFLIEQEDCVKSQANVYTILTLHSKFREHSQMLSMLWDIHTTSVLDEDKYPPHIRSAFLIASLNYHVFHSTHKCKKNLSISFLLVCLQSYLKIFETWWTEARLQDLKMEFLVEKVLSNENEIVQPRLFEKCKEKAFYINDVVANRISQDPIIGTMHFYAMEASVTLETISKLDRVHEMKQIKNTSKSLYDEFIERINREIKNLASNDISFNQNGDDENADKPREFSKNQKIVDDIKNGMTEEGDEMMLLIFNSTFEDLTSIDGSRNTTESPSQLDIYKKLNKATNSILLPLENSIQRHLNELLMKKISIAERFVMDIFFNELLVEQFLQEIRKVFFLESHELMNYFNMKLFPLMENGDSSWANSYLMTMTLNEAIRSGRQYSTLFTVQVNKKLGHLSVFDAIDEIEIHVNMNSIFENIFTLESMSKYNEVFKFLLKIKYGQKILNHLLYPDFFKHRKPYANLKMLDLVIKRLALTRFSMQQTINTIHNHLMVILQGICNQFDLNVSRTEKINDLIACHNRFVNTFYRKAFLNEESKKTRGIIIEMLKLAKVIKDEWNNIITFHSLDSAGKIDDNLTLAKLNVNTIEIEKAFKACENQLRKLLDYY